MMPHTCGQWTKWRRRVVLRSPQAWRPVRMKSGRPGEPPSSRQTSWTQAERRPGDGSASSAPADPRGFFWLGPVGVGGFCCTSAALSCTRKASHDALGSIQAARWRGDVCDAGSNEEERWKKTNGLQTWSFHIWNSA